MPSFIRHRPSACLEAVIDCLWMSTREQELPECEHMLPSGKAQLVIPLHDSPIEWADADRRWHSWTRGMVHGPQSRYYLAGPKPKGTVVGVSFRPGMASLVLGVGLDELQDRHVSLEELWGYRGLDLQERLAACGTDSAAIFALLETEMLARIRRPLLIHPAVAFALQSRLVDASRVEDAQRRSGYSPRHFIELFRSTVGLAPKQYYRVRRFSKALAQIARGESRLAEVAATAGYSDQAHLSREFRELAGVAPSAYRPRAADSEHHHVVDASR